MSRPVAVLLFLACCGALLLAATPQGTPRTERVPLKYGDRCSGLIGQRFNFPDRGSAVQQADGALKLVSVGVDFAEFTEVAGDGRTYLVPLAQMLMTLSK